MVNSDISFRFKQFSVVDAHCAMKVGTDGVLLGAWCDVPSGCYAWDIGAGCGLISLMLAQRGASRVTGFEISSDAVTDFKLNVSRTQWNERIYVVEGDFTHVDIGRLEKPDLIVSNPPFYDEDLQSPDCDRALARHGSTLSFAVLFDVAAAALAPGGSLCVIAPSRRFEELEFDAMLRKLYLRSAMFVSTKEGKAPGRVMMKFDRSVSGPREVRNLSIRSNGEFTDEYRELTSEFYLNF